MKNIHYRLEIYWDVDLEEPNYIAKFYDVPVLGQGETVEEAVAEAYANLDVYIEECKIENIELPVPSKHIKVDNLSGKFTLRVSKTMHSMIISRAEEEGVSINSFLNDAIAKYVYSKNETKSNRHIIYNNIDNKLYPNIYKQSDDNTSGLIKWINYKA